MKSILQYYIPFVPLKNIHIRRSAVSEISPESKKHDLANPNFYFRVETVEKANISNTYRISKTSPKKVKNLVVGQKSAGSEVCC